MDESTAIQLQVQGVSKTYGEHHINAVVSLSMEIERGRFVALTGPSGCGKSTLLNLIAGIDKPSSGRILLDGIDLSSQSDEKITKLRAKKIGFIFQFFNLLSTLTVFENVLLPLELSDKQPHKEREKKVRDLLERVGMSDRAGFYPSQLSGGEMQRTAIARALIHSPHLILADEPTGNLDTENGKAVLDLLKEINSEFQTTILMATHSTEAASYAQSVIEMKDGAIIGTVKDVR